MNAEMTLDEAWAAAEAALPAGWTNGPHVGTSSRGGYRAWAQSPAWFEPDLHPRWTDAEGRGPTPTAALIALTARLQEQPR